MKKIGILTEVDIVLHKMVIYGKDNFFNEHIDSQHSKNQIATLSIELSTQSSDRNLRIGKTIIDKPKKGTLQLSLFYIDTEHEVRKLTQEHRISILFDVIQKELITNIDAFKPMHVR